jgi:methylated-DNA-[protein]-cysteine S-methyltransferase
MTATLFSTTMPSPIGELTIVADDDAIVAIRWDTESYERQPDAHNPVDAWIGRRGVDVAEAPEHPVLAGAVAQLTEYFAGERTEFDLPLAPAGTDFQQSAWHALRGIPFGETVSYGEQAAAMGDRRKARAVGAANGRNPIPIVVPCHRVVGSNGHLTGFAGGIEVKAWLLDHELRVRAGG